jgi:hypothetical protein
MGDVIDSTALRTPNLAMHAHIHIATKLMNISKADHHLDILSLSILQESLVSGL